MTIQPNFPSEGSLPFEQPRRIEQTPQMDTRLELGQLKSQVEKMQEIVRQFTNKISSGLLRTMADFLGKDKGLGKMLNYLANTPGAKMTYLREKTNGAISLDASKSEDVRDIQQLSAQTLEIQRMWVGKQHPQIDMQTYSFEQHIDMALETLQSQGKAPSLADLLATSAEILARNRTESAHIGQAPQQPEVLYGIPGLTKTAPLALSPTLLPIPNYPQQQISVSKSKIQIGAATYSFLVNEQPIEAQSIQAGAVEGVQNLRVIFPGGGETTLNEIVNKFTANQTLETIIVTPTIHLKRVPVQQ